MAVIDLAFALVGKSLPVDHGYALYGALCRVLPALHVARDVGIHHVRGRAVGGGQIMLGQGARLRLRLPSEQIGDYLKLCDKRLDVDGHLVRIGIPQVEPLIPAPNLHARLVTFKGMTQPEPFLDCCRRHLDEMGIAAQPVQVPSTRPQYAGQPFRRILRVKDRKIVGYALQVLGLTAEESIVLQEKGLGGRRRFGAGLFLPIQENSK